MRRHLETDYYFFRGGGNFHLNIHDLFWCNTWITESNFLPWLPLCHFSPAVFAAPVSLSSGVPHSGP